MLSSPCPSGRAGSSSARHLASTREIAAALGLLALLAFGQSGCGSSIGVWPHAAVNDDLVAMIESAGSDPADWAVDNNCANMGNCSATLAAAAFPERVLATNIYVVKDSRAALTGTDSIESAVKRAVRDKCLERFGKAGPLASCIGGGPPEGQAGETGSSSTLTG